MKNVSEIIKQFDWMKERHPNTLILIEDNDCYITFDKDAEIVADKCYVVLSRLVTCGRVFCKLYKSNIEKYITTLRKNCYRIALCDQLNK